jgi:hypothetical protein
MYFMELHCIGVNFCYYLVQQNRGLLEFEFFFFNSFGSIKNIYEEMII